MRPQRRRIHLRPSRQNNIANELRNPRPIRARNHNRLRHTRVPNQRGLDLPSLNAEAANLNLMVRSLHNPPNSHRPQTTVQYIDLQVEDAAPDENAAGRAGKVSVEQNMTDMPRRLGDAIHVDQRRGTVGAMLIPVFESPHIQRFTPKDHMTQNKRSSELRMLPLCLHQLIKCRRRLVENGDAFARNQRQKLSGRAADRIGNDDQSTAMEKWTPNLPY